jgi:ribonuclease HII
VTEPDLGRYEREIRRQGFRILAGVDEAGRGALAGPLVAAAVILPEDFDRSGLRDSKVLTPKRRLELFGRIVEQAIAFSICRAMPSRIDRRGLHRTNLWLLRRAVARLPVAPEFLLTDGFALRRVALPSLSVKKGDAVMASVAAASILAKVARDRSMDRYHRRFPEYGFNRNRGYGTSEHLRAIRRFGASPIHRRSFASVPDA